MTRKYYEGQPEDSPMRTYANTTDVTFLSGRTTSARFVDSIFEANDMLQEAIEKMCAENTILPDAVRARIGRASNLLATYCLLNPQTATHEARSKTIKP